jgi:exodeoxyribonuclease VIII
MSNEEYQRLPYISASGLKVLARSPAHYQAWLTLPRVETPALFAGTLIHTAVIQPELLETDYTVIPDDLDRRTKAGKERWAEIEESGKKPVKQEDMENAKLVAGAVHAHPLAGSLFEPDDESASEISIFWEHGVILDGVAQTIQCRGRPDRIKKMGNRWILVDLKTTDDVTRFEHSIAAYQYHLQIAHYLRGLSTTDKFAPVDHALFVAVEKAPPYGVGIFELSQSYLQKGYEECERLYRIFAQCVRDDKWESYPAIIREVEMPRWMSFKEEE